MCLATLVFRVAWGREMACALTVLRLIAGTFGKTPPGELARFVFLQLPRRWRHPYGPATEDEFMRMVSAGIDFYRSVRYVLMH